MTGPSGLTGLVKREPTKAAFVRAEITQARAAFAPHVEGRKVGRSTYINHGCRCDGCKRAHRLYGQRWRAARGARTQLNPLVTKVRDRERRLRENLARQRALAALGRIHADQYRTLVTIHRNAINAERGPLPGDTT